MGPELGNPDNVVVGDGDNEPAPIEISRIETRSVDQVGDRRLILGSGRSDRYLFGRHVIEISPRFGIDAVRARLDPDYLVNLKSAYFTDPSARRNSSRRQVFAQVLSVFHSIR